MSYSQKVGEKRKVTHIVLRKVLGCLAVFVDDGLFSEGQGMQKILHDDVGS